jgi:hypothetical protein
LRLGERVVRLARGVPCVVAPPVGVDLARRRLAGRRRALGLPRLHHRPVGFDGSEPAGAGGFWG